MKRAKVHLNNGEVADITLFFDEIETWLLGIAERGIRSENSYFPYHSIAYILFEDAATTAIADVVDSNNEYQIPDEVN